MSYRLSSLGVLVVACCSAVGATAGVIAPAMAGTLYVCADARGQRSYQDAPCARDARAIGTRAFVARPPDAALAARTRAIETEMDRRNRGGAVRATSVRASARKPEPPSPCQAAKARRDTTLKRVGLKRDFDLLSRLDGEVWDACKGF